MALKTKINPAKAAQILKDGTANGKPLSPKQRRFMGAMAGGQKMTKAKDGTTVSAGEAATLGKGGERTVPIYKDGSAKKNILEGMQDGGGTQYPVMGTQTPTPTTAPAPMDSPTPTPQSAGEANPLSAVMDVFNTFGEKGIQALMLGLQSARMLHRTALGTPPTQTPMGPQPANVPDFHALLQQEVQRAFQALSGPQAGMVPTPPTGTPTPTPVP